MIFKMFDPLTWGFVIIILLYFFKSIKELWKVKAIKKELEDFVKILDKAKSEVLDESNDIKTLEERYKCYIELLEKKNFKQLNEQIQEYNAILKYRNYSRIKAEDYFNENSILENKINIHSIGNKASVLTGLGILGTFVGLAIGLYKINNSNLAKNLTVIDNLIPKMGLAFITSIFGMFFSLIYSSCQKRILGDVYKNINEIESVLEFLFPSQLDIETTLGRIEVNLEKFTKEASKTIEKSSYEVTKQTFKEFGKQFQEAAKNAGSDLLSGVNNAVNQIFTNEFLKSFKDIHKSFAEIAKTLEKNKDILENIEKASKNSESIYENAQKTAQAYDEFLHKMNDFMNIISTFERVQTEFGNEVKNMVNNSNRIQEDMEKLFNTNRIEIEKLVNYMINGYNLTNDETKKMIIQVLEINREILNLGKEIANNNRDRVAEIEKSIDGSLEKIQAKIIDFDSVVKSNNESTNQMLKENIEFLNSSITSNNNKVTQYSEIIGRSIIEQNKIINNQNNEIVKMQNQISEKTAETLKIYDETFSKVNKQLLNTVSIVKEMSKAEE